MAMQPVYSTFALDADPDKQMFEYQSAVGSFQLFLLFSFGTDPERAAREAFDEAIEKVEKRLRSCQKGKSFACFEQALKDVNTVFDNPTDVGDHVASGPLEVDAIVGVLDGSTLHVAKTGQAESYLIRRGTLVEITEGMEANDADGLFTTVATGDLAENDKVLLTTRRLLRFVKKTDLVAMFSPRDIAASLEELQAVLESEDSGSVAVSACLMEGETEEVKEAKAAPRKRGSHQERLTSGSVTVRAGTVKGELSTAAVTMRVWMRHGWGWFRQQNRRRQLQILGSILGALAILFGISLFVSSSERGTRVAEMEQAFQQARSYVADARNRKLFDTTGAKASLEEAKKRLMEVARSGLFYNDVQQLLAEIQQEEEGTDRTTRVTNPKVVAELAKKDGNISVVDLISFNQAFYVLTANGILGPIVDSSPDSYGKSAVEGGEVFVSAEHFPDRGVIAILTRANKLVEFKDNNFSFMETEDGTWKTGTEIRTYANRQFIYILDPASNAIWKYERTNKRYRAATNYNNDRTDIKDAISFAIDGSLYVLKANGEVKRFYNQKLQPFSVDGGPSVPLSNLALHSKIATNENLRNIYVLDAGNERVLIYRKQTFEKTDRMVYDRQFVFKGEDLRDLYIDDNEQSLYVATAQRILRVDLKVL